MKFIAAVLFLSSILVENSLAHERVCNWAESWNSLSKNSRQVRNIYPLEPDGGVVVTGLHGLRYASSGVTLCIDVAASSVTQWPTSQPIVDVVWSASPDECYGKAFPVGNKIRFLLTMELQDIRLVVASREPLRLRDRSSHFGFSFDMPSTNYDLDLQRFASSEISHNELLQVSAQNQKLAIAEAKYIHEDVKQGRMTHEEAQDQLDFLFSLLVSLPIHTNGNAGRVRSAHSR